MAEGDSSELFELGKLCTGHDADELQVLEHESGG
jgi:hypothetical protein